MRKLILVLALIPCLSFADSWFEMPNGAGGKIILTMSTCINSKDGKLVIATTPKGDNLHGCWYYFADMVHVVWTDGRTSSFAPNSFSFKEAK
jgi:hypothetical protein